MQGIKATDDDLVNEFGIVDEDRIYGSQKKDD